MMRENGHRKPAPGEEIEACARVRDCLAQQQAALLAHDPQKVSETTGALQAALDALGELTRQRAQLPGCPAAERKTLQALCSDIRRSAIFNREIITDTLAYTRMTLDALTPSESTYQRRQRRESALHPA